MSQPSRRAVLQVLSVGTAGLALGCWGRSSTTRPAGAEASFRPNLWVHLRGDGSLAIVCHRSEMGQGVRSTLPALIALEMGADRARVQVVQGDADERYGSQDTDGSSSIRLIYDDLRQLGATARAMLITAAAARWGVPEAECTAQGHRVAHSPTERTLGFGELAADAARLPVPDPVPLPPVHDRAAMAALPLVDGPAIVTGAARYGADVRVPGMLVAVIARPPVVGGTVAQHDASAARAVPGVREVVVLPAPTPPWGFQPLGGVAVVAEHTWAALQGREALSITWNHGANEAYDSTAYREALAGTVAQPGTVIRRRGDVQTALKGAAKVLEADYHVPHLPHLPMEPPVALARVDGERCEIWASTQNPQAIQASVAAALGLEPSSVTVHVTLLGGGFGRKSKTDYAVEAALLSREVGAPVRVQWTREDDIRHDYVNTVATQRLTAGLDASGKIVAWRHRTVFPPIGTLFGRDPIAGAGELQQGVLDLPLDVPHVSAETGRAESHARIGWLRSVYNIFHAFAVGSFVDELAQTRGTDPLDTWLELVGAPRRASLDELGIEQLSNYGHSLDTHPVDVGRLRGVLERVTTAARWSERAGRALGLAVHRSFVSYAAVVASVKERADGRLAVDEVWIALDAGIVVNPERVRSQMEGAVIFGTSLALFGEISFEGGAVTQSNFVDGGRLVRMGEAPRIHVELIESDAAPGGVGEPGVPPVAPAIVNAVAALTGQRIRELPLSKSLSV